MATSENDIKLLWGGAAGICSNPSCRRDLILLLKDVARLQIGEMAHVIAKNPGGPRGKRTGGSDGYENLILLCPTCHRLIDKASKSFPPKMLLNWKADHEQSIRQRGRELKFATFAALQAAVRPMLVENCMLWSQMGPKSKMAEDLGSNGYVLWTLRKMDTIVPNNQKIINAIEANIELVGGQDLEAFYQFKQHATGFYEHQISKLDSYPLFPAVFGERFGQ